MTENEFWDVAVISIAAIRMHPRNDNIRDVEAEMDIATRTANILVINRRLKWLGLDPQSAQPSHSSAKEKQTNPTPKSPNATLPLTQTKQG